MEIKSDIEYAIYSHGAWKARFRNFLSGKTGLDLSAIGHTESCKLGKWLADEARRMLSLEDHVKTCELHAPFHRVAGDIVHNIKQKNFSAARQALGAAGAFDQASQGTAKEAALRHDRVHAHFMRAKKQGHAAPVCNAPETTQRLTGLAAISSSLRALMTWPFSAASLALPP